jgi:hypothetical protein
MVKEGDLTAAGFVELTGSGDVGNAKEVVSASAYTGLSTPHNF